MTDATDPKTFWDNKILIWEESRYGARSRSWLESLAGHASSSLRFRMEAAAALLVPHVKGRRVVELGCGSGLLAERLMGLGAASYQGYDISEQAVAKANQRTAASAFADTVAFKARPVAELPDLGDALVFSLGLFDWLNPAEIGHVFAMGRQGSYFHAVAERRLSAQQLLHRLYVHLAYGHRTGGYVPQYQSVAEIARVTAGLGLGGPNVYRDDRMRFGIFISDLPLPSSPVTLP